MLDAVILGPVVSGLGPGVLVVGPVVDGVGFDERGGGLGPGAGPGPGCGAGESSKILIAIHSANAAMARIKANAASQVHQAPAVSRWGHGSGHNRHLPAPSRRNQCGRKSGPRTSPTGSR